jgi:multiple sugar transport system permease protein
VGARRPCARLSERPGPWLAPMLALVTAFFLLPVVEVARLALSDATLTSTEVHYGLDTLAEVVSHPETPGVVVTTLVFVLASVVFQLGVGLLVALVVERGVRRRLPGSVFVRTVVLSAWVIPGVMVGVLWQIVLNENRFGVVNAALGGAGLPAVPFLSDPQWALASIIIANVWRGTAFSMILIFAGLRGLPRQVYEAAATDGASGLRVLRSITLPQLKPILLITLILTTIATFNTFDMVLALTGGGPGRATEVLALRAYNSLFERLDLSGAAALAVMMMLLTLAFVAVYSRFLSREDGM